MSFISKAFGKVSKAAKKVAGKKISKVVSLKNVAKVLPATALVSKGARKEVVSSYGKYVGAAGAAYTGGASAAVVGVAASSGNKYLDAASQAYQGDYGGAIDSIFSRRPDAPTYESSSPSYGGESAEPSAAGGDSSRWMMIAAIASVAVVGLVLVVRK